MPNFLGFESVLYSWDIESLYTFIPIDLGIEESDCWITRKHDLITEQCTKGFIIDSIKFILKSNNFLFYSKMFGTAMGLNVHPLMLASLQDIKKKINFLLKDYQSTFQSKNVN